MDNNLLTLVVCADRASAIDACVPLIMSNTLSWQLPQVPMAEMHQALHVCYVREQIHGTCMMHFIPY